MVSKKYINIFRSIRSIDIVNVRTSNLYANAVLRRKSQRILTKYRVQNEMKFILK